VAAVLPLPARTEADVTVVSRARLPTRHGEFQIVAFRFPDDAREHVALVRGDTTQARPIPVRIHSECLTGDGFGSLRCDCRDQLERSLAYLGTQPNGVLIYLRQEGRGIGLTNKVRAYQLQDKGLDTFQANEALGFADDPRDFRVAAQMLRALGVGAVRLMSNNPAKIAALEREGIHVAERIPLVIKPTPHSANYLWTKRTKGGHLLLDAPTAAATGL
jgi:GTP cyclohydrolase II